MKSILLYTSFLYWLCAMAVAESQALETHTKPPALNADGSMVFIPFSECETGNGCGENVALLAEGIITQDSVNLLKATIAKQKTIIKKLWGGGITTICFNSNGGNLEGAIALGQYIRKAKLNTCLKDRYMLLDKNLDFYYENDLKNLSAFEKANFSFDKLGGVYRINTQCLSACVFAFIGGLDRYIGYENDDDDRDEKKKTKIGVHQISGDKGDIGDGATQRQIAFLNNYVREMGVHQNLVNTLLSTPANKITFLSRKTIKDLRVEHSSGGELEVDEDSGQWEIFVDDNAKPYAQIKWKDINHISGEMTLTTMNGRPTVEIRYIYLEPSDAKEAIKQVFNVNEKPTLYVNLKNEQMGYEINDGQWRLINGNTVILRGSLPLKMVESLKRGDSISTELWFGVVRFLAPINEVPLDGLPKLLPTVFKLN